MLGGREKLEKHYSPSMSPLQNSKNDWLNNQQQQMKASIQEPASNTRKQQPSDTNVYKKAKVTHQQDTHIPCFTLLSPSMREQEHTLSSFPTTIKAINTRLAAHPKKHSYDNSNNDENAAVENMAKSSLKTRISPLLSPDDSDEDLLRTGTGLTPLAAQLRINAFKQQQQQHVQRPMQQNTLPSRPFLPGYPLVEEQQVSISKNDIGNDDVSLSLSAANKASLVLPPSTMDGIARDVPLEEERVALEVYQHAHGEYAKYEDVSHAVQNEKNVTTTTSSIIAAAATAAAVPLKFHTTNNNNYPRSLLALQPPPKQQQYAKNPLAPSYSNSSSFLPSVLTFDSISHTLTSFEKSEILHYNTIYYAGKMAIKKIQGRLNAKEHNYGYDDRHGNYHIVLHDHIAYRYEILHLLGCGSFGQVVRCLDHATGRPVALKIIKNKENFKNQARMEATILTQLCRHEHHGSTHIVQMMDSFVFRNHVCITFELLSLNLYEYIKENSFNGCGITMVRGIAGQVLRTLCFLRLQKIVHCDIKPENILMTSKGSSSIKVIDFGSACYENQRVFAYIQSRFYRCVQVHEGLP